MKRVILFIERLLIYGILLLMSIMLILSFVDLLVEIVRQVIQPPFLLIDTETLMELFSIILVLLIGIELLETIKLYLKEDTIHVELVILVAIIAVARKVIIWDFTKYEVKELIGISVILLALGITYLLLKRADLRISNPLQKRSKKKISGKTPKSK